MADDEPLLTSAEPCKIVDGWLVVVDDKVCYHQYRVSEVAGVQALPASTSLEKVYCNVILRSGIRVRACGPARVISQTIREYERERTPVEKGMTQLFHGGRPFIDDIEA